MSLSPCAQDRRDADGKPVVRGRSVRPQAEEIGDHILNLLGAENRPPAVRSKHPVQPLGGMIGRHDGVRVERLGVDQPQAQLSRAGATADTIQRQPQTAVKLPSGQRHGVTHHTVAALAVEHDTSPAFDIAGLVGEGSRQSGFGGRSGPIGKTGGETQPPHAGQDGQDGRKSNEKKHPKQRYRP